MKPVLLISFLLILLFSCKNKQEKNILAPENWQNRNIKTVSFETYVKGSTYLPVYSQIYQLHGEKTYDLTVTISMRNISPADTVYLFNANYYNTYGDKIRSYIQQPVFLKPLETIEIVIDEADKEGGTGANFIFNWAVKNKNITPLFEAVMISTTGQQGISFLTKGVKIENTGSH